MCNGYTKEYYENYDLGEAGKVNYIKSDYLRRFFSEIADRIITDLHPKTVLDAGCAMGVFVAELRKRGVEAYGIDSSEYAVENADPDAGPWCIAASLAEPIPDEINRKYDLVTCFEVLEHMSEEDGRIAISNICSLSDTVIFCSTPDDYEDPTHINVRRRPFWAKCFAENGFYDDLSYRPLYLTAYAVCYRKREIWTDQVVEYEEYIENQDIQTISQIRNEQQARLTAEALLKTQIAETAREVAARLSAEETIGKLRTELEEKEKTIEDNKKQYEEIELAHFAKERQLSQQLDDVTALYNKASSDFLEIQDAFFWRITAPARGMIAGIRQFFSNHYMIRSLFYIIGLLFKYGPVDTVNRYKAHKKELLIFKMVEMGFDVTREEAVLQQRTKFEKKIKFSIIVPLYNTEEEHLCAMLDSILVQTYSNWELCLADGSDSQHNYIQKICRKYYKKDRRIKYRKLNNNLGISGNSNACIEMAEGDYLVLLDHDDLLHPFALFEVMKAICDKDADFIYTDENTFHLTPGDAYNPHYKPDFSPDTLRSYNYICHLTVFKRDLLQMSEGAFKSEYDGSQDYDLILRLTEAASHIVHIPKVLYYWRAHSNSVAEDIGAKEYAIDAAKKAIFAHLKRIGYDAEVLDSKVPSTYRIKYIINGAPKVSVLIPNKDHAEDLKRCVDSIINHSTYANYEIIIIENNSKEENTFNYYVELEKHNHNGIKVVTWQGAFNYSAINNFGFKETSGDYILLLNNDTEVITPDWIEQMLMFAQRKDVGAVGAMLYYPDDTIQHAGVIVGLGGVAGHSHKYYMRGDKGYAYRLTIAQNLSGVTAACMMIRRDVWEKVSGFDESFEVAFNDVDLCLRIRKAGYLIVWTPYAELYHYESKSRGAEDTPEKQKRFQGEVNRFQQRWEKELAEGDPYYNPNLTLNAENFEFKKL